MRLRLTLALVAVVALVLAVHDIPLSGYLERVERDRLVTQLERDAFIIAGRTEEALEAGVTATQAEVIDALIAEYAFAQNVRVVVVDADAVAVFESAGSSGEDFSNRPEIASALSGQPATGERESVTLGEDLFYVAVPVLTGDSTVGAVRLSAPERVVSDEVSGQVRGLFLVAALSLLIAAVVAVVVAVTVTRPLERLRRATTLFAKGDLSARVDASSGPGEVRELAVSFNTMAARLESLVDRQRAFAGDASHQLRTPLTALRLRLDRAVSRSHARGDVDDQLGDDLDAALLETDRLHRMIEGLLALTRAEDAAVGPTVTDVAAIAGERVEHWSPLAAERDVSVVSDAPALAAALAVPGSVEQIIDNLIDNALDASPPGGEVVVSVDVLADRVELRVMDSGEGLDAVERVQALQRFWRGPTAPQGGSGLGLAIVRQLAQAAGGDVELQASPAGGLAAVVTLRSP